MLDEKGSNLFSTIIVLVLMDSIYFKVYVIDIFNGFYLINLKKLY